MPQLRISQDAQIEQDAISSAVQEVYDIDRDDAGLRSILESPREERGGCFDSLRKNYPVRREFQNTRVIVEDVNIGLAGKLAGIGFEVRAKSEE